MKMDGIGETGFVRHVGKFRKDRDMGDCLGNMDPLSNLENDLATDMSDIYEFLRSIDTSCFGCAYYVDCGDGKWYCKYLANDYIIISEMYEKVPYLVMEYGSCGTFRRRKD